MLNHVVTTQQEWITARTLVEIARPSESDPGHGVALVVKDNRRQWIAWTGRVTVATKPTQSLFSEDEVLLMSPRFVDLAGELAADGVQVTLEVSELGTALKHRYGSLLVSQPSARALPAIVDWPWEALDACVQVQSRDLRRLISLGGVRPRGVDDRAEKPEFFVGANDEDLVGGVDWRTLGGPHISYDVGAHVHGVSALSICADLAAHVVGFTDPEELLDLAFPTDEPWLGISTSLWEARIRGSRGPQDDDLPELAFNDPVDECDDEGQLELFETENFVVYHEDEVVEDMSLTDAKALALDPEPEIRAAAAESLWNWDVNLQCTLAADPDVRVVLILLEHVDLCPEAGRIVMDGPHELAKAELVRRAALHDNSRDAGS